MHSSQEQGGDVHVDKHPNHVVRNRDKRACCQGWVDFHPVEQHRNQRAKDTGKHHDGKQTDGNRDCNDAVAKDEEVVDKHHQADDAGIDERDERFLDYLREDMSFLQRVIRQTLHHDS